MRNAKDAAEVRFCTNVAAVKSRDDKMKKPCAKSTVDSFHPKDFTKKYCNNC